MTQCSLVCRLRSLRLRTSPACLTSSCEIFVPLPQMAPQFVPPTISLPPVVSASKYNAMMSDLEMYIVEVPLEIACASKGEVATGAGVRLCLV